MSEDPFRDMFEFDTLDGTKLIIEIEQGDRIDQLSLLIVHDFGEPIGVVTTKWMHLEAHQAVTLARAILGRWGSLDEPW